MLLRYDGYSLLIWLFYQYLNRAESPDYFSPTATPWVIIIQTQICARGSLKEIKRHNIRWVKTKDNRYQKFSWQGEYADFPVSQSLQQKMKPYIKNQEDHPNSMTFREELIKFPKEYGIEYSEQYLCIY